MYSFFNILFIAHLDSAQYKTPVFKLKNTITGNFLTAPGSVDGDVTNAAAGANQDWYYIQIFVYCYMF